MQKFSLFLWPLQDIKRFLSRWFATAAALCWKRQGQTECAGIEDISLLFFRIWWRGEKNLTGKVQEQGRWWDFSCSVCKVGRRGFLLFFLYYYYHPPLIGPKPLTQSVRPSNALHHLHYNTQTHFNDVWAERRRCAGRTREVQGLCVSSAHVCAFDTTLFSDLLSAGDSLSFLTALVAQVIAATRRAGLNIHWPHSAGTLHHSPTQVLEVGTGGFALSRRQCLQEFWQRTARICSKYPNSFS